MTVDQVLQFYTENIHIVIQSLVTALLLLILFMGWRTFFSKSASGENNHGGGDGSAISNKEFAQPDAVFQAHMEALQKQLSELKNDVKNRGDSVQTGSFDLKGSPLDSGKSAGGTKSEGFAKSTQVQASADSTQLTKDLQSKITELEERLAEYEIIEDDIADLSFYKSEVLRLQALVDGQPREPRPQDEEDPSESDEFQADESEADKSEATESQGDESEAVESQADESDESQPLGEIATTETLEAEGTPKEVSPDLLTATLDAVTEEAAFKSDKVNLDEAATGEESLAATPENSASDTAPVAPSPDMPSDDISDVALEDDLMAEFTAAVEMEEGIEPGSSLGAASSDASPAVSSIEGELDMEKMFSEAQEIVESASNEDSDINALESDIDPEKLAEEALAMAGATGGENLMDEFEQFTKKGSKVDETN